MLILTSGSVLLVRDKEVKALSVKNSSVSRTVVIIYPIIKQEMQSFFMMRSKSYHAISLSFGLNSSIVEMFVSEIYEHFSANATVSKSNVSNKMLVRKLSSLLGLLYKLVLIDENDLFNNVVDLIHMLASTGFSVITSNDNGCIDQYVSLKKTEDHYVLSLYGSGKLYGGYNSANDYMHVFIKKLIDSSSIAFSEKIKQLFKNGISTKACVYDFFRYYGLSHQIASTSKISHTMPFVSYESLVYADKMKHFVINSKHKEILQCAGCNKIKVAGQSEMIDQPNIALHAVFSCFCNLFHSYSVANDNANCTYSKLVARTHEKALFDILAIKREKTNCHYTNDIICGSSFIKMYS